MSQAALDILRRARIPDRRELLDLHGGALPSSLEQPHPLPVDSNIDIAEHQLAPHCQLSDSSMERKNNAK